MRTHECAHTRLTQVAIKFEPVRKGEGSRLATEFAILRALKGATGFAVPRYFGTQVSSTGLFCHINRPLLPYK